MRRGNDPKFIHVAEDGLLMAPERKNHDQSAIVGLDSTTRTLGVNLGADYCAEHEWGIEGLYQAFGVKNEIGVYGLKRRKISKVPESLVWVKLIDGRQGLAYRNYWYAETPKIEVSQAAAQCLIGDNEIMAYDIFDRPTRKMKVNPVQLACAWSEDDFACLSSDSTDIKYLREIFDAFAKKNIVLTFAASLPAFDNPGLIIAIADRLPKEVTGMWKQADVTAHALRKAVDATGIEKLLKEKGRRYFALSPKLQSDGSISYWLNPMEQDRNNFGWYRLEDLKDWAEGKGNIPMSKAQLEERAAARRRR